MLVNGIFSTQIMQRELIVVIDDANVKKEESYRKPELTMEGQLRDIPAGDTVSEG